MRSGTTYCAISCKQHKTKHVAHEFCIKEPKKNCDPEQGEIFKYNGYVI